MSKIYQKTLSNTKGAVERKLGSFGPAVSAVPVCANSRPFGRCGFTLIELLVVVLIIGILAAVALPQYQRVVDKTRLSQVFVWAAPIMQAEKIYQMANGTYTPYMEDLDITPPNCKFKNITYEDKGGRGRYGCNDNWTVDLNAWQNRLHIYLPSQDPVDATVELVFYLDTDSVLCGSTSQRWRNVCASFGGQIYSDNGSMQYWTIPQN